MDSQDMIELIPFEAVHFDLLIEWSPTPEFLLQWAGPEFTYPLGKDQLERLLHSSRGTPPTSHLFMARRVSDGTLIGHGELGQLTRRISVPS